MRVNIFSGGRRIALACGVLAVAAAGALAWIINPPRYSLTYRVAAGIPIPINGFCNYSSEASGSAYLPSDAGPDIYLLVCLPAAVQPDADRIAARFPVPPADKERANAELSRQITYRYGRLAAHRGPGVDCARLP
jgi:hypothetical protein